MSRVEAQTLLRIGALAARSGFRAMLASWDRRLAGTPVGERAGLLEALATGAEGEDQGRHPLHAPVPRRETGVRGRGVRKR